jgi:hypothetical protein
LYEPWLFVDLIDSLDIEGFTLSAVLLQLEFNNAGVLRFLDDAN